MNIGIGDVRNLCWKLAMALADPALEGLLDSYEPERRPVAQAVAANSLASFHNAVGVVDTALGLTVAQSPQDGWRNIEMLWLDGPDGDARRAAMGKAVRSLDLEFTPTAPTADSATRAARSSRCIPAPSHSTAT
jgi:2,4-dichlorophenol 6-monooxygenase